jgi:hypothetical protein
MSFWTNPLQSIATAIGVVKVDVNSVIAKAITRVQLGEHELAALIQWGADNETKIAAGLTAAAPIISEIGVMATVAATGNPAAGAAVGEALNLVNNAMSIAETSVAAMNASGAALKASQAAGNGDLVNDTTAIAAGVTAVVHSSASVTAITTAAITAANMIQAAVKANPVPVPAPAPAQPGA